MLHERSSTTSGFRAEYHDGAYAFAHFRNLTVTSRTTMIPSITRPACCTSTSTMPTDSLPTGGMTVEGPRNEDYGKHEGRHVDPDGDSSGSVHPSQCDDGSVGQVRRPKRRSLCNEGESR